MNGVTCIKKQYSRKSIGIDTGYFFAGIQALPHLGYDLGQMT